MIPKERWAEVLPNKSKVADPVKTHNKIGNVLGNENFGDHDLNKMASLLKSVFSENEKLNKENGDLRRKNEDLEKKLHIDKLTQINNREGFETATQAELERASRYGHEVSIAMIDIDFFKAVNDTYGHSTGDIVLKKVAQIIQENARSTDIVARWGGEEFCILFPETNEEGAYQALEKIRRVVEETKIKANGEIIQVKVSAGVVERRGEEELKVLQERADMALYESKEGGRNKVTVFEDKTK